MNPTTWHHPAARMAGRAGGAGTLGAAAAAAVLAATNTVTGDMAISASQAQNHRTPRCRSIESGCTVQPGGRERSPCAD